MPMRATLKIRVILKEVTLSKMTHNFCAGPAALPKAVLEKAQAELLDWQGMGVSVMEISHRSDEYQAMAKNAEANFRQLLDINDDHAVLFLHGGATQQFSNIPMTLLTHGRQAEYLCNGIWSAKAAKEAARFGKVNSVEMMEIDGNGNRSLKDLTQVSRIENPIYTHYTPNETIEGLRYQSIPKSCGAVVADLSSCILSEQIKVSDFDFIYAGAQKNIGPAGLTIAIVKRSLFELMDFSTSPGVFNYQAQAENGSMINTPATYSWYLAGLVFDWLLEQGGVQAMEAAAIEKSNLLYECIDEDDFYRNPIAVKDRSRMNIPFILKDESLNERFLNEAKQAYLVGLKGHRSVGGMRASLYNAMPVEGVNSLIQFMRDFKQANG